MAPLSPRDRDLIKRLFGSPVDLPPAFKSWISSWIQSNVPRVPVSQLQGGGAWMPGMVGHTAASTAPEGFLMCDGSAVSRDSYSDLFAAIGTQYGVGDGSTTFNLPDARGRTHVGLWSGEAQIDTLGEKPGAYSETLETSQIPAHGHTVNITTGTESANHQHGIGRSTDTSLHPVENTGASVRLRGVTLGGSGTDGGVGSGVSDSQSVTHTHSVSGNTGNNGGGLSHNNMQPSIVFNAIIKY